MAKLIYDTYEKWEACVDRLLGNTKNLNRDELLVLLKEGDRLYGPATLGYSQLSTSVEKKRNIAKVLGLTNTDS